MTTNLPVDPSDIKITLESLVRKVDKIRSQICGLHVKDERKTSYPVNCIWHIFNSIITLEAGRAPGVDDLTDDDDGNLIISELDPEALIMSSQDWETLGLPPMGEF